MSKADTVRLITALVLGLAIILHGWVQTPPRRQLKIRESGLPWLFEPSTGRVWAPEDIEGTSPGFQWKLRIEGPDE